MTEFTWRCVGYHTDGIRLGVKDSLLYVTDTAEHAEALCRAHIPRFHINYTQRVDELI